MEAIAYTFEVSHINNVEIDNYMKNAGPIVLSDKVDRQITGNINRAVLDTEYRSESKWMDDETIQVYEAYDLNQCIRKIGKGYAVPFEEMLKAL